MTVGRVRGSRARAFVGEGYLQAGAGQSTFQ